ncbi:MAG: adenylate/guanylate cyclase domain-containing protein, partial [Elusimicrobiota bacterium]|nr:adenylate/guanylate cyclase domain-containing protein [Elusimicrobiota bacterium]
APAAPSRAPDAPRPVDSVRVERAATMFASLDGWATAYERYGRRRAYSAVKAFHAHVREAVESRGGVVVKTEGETVMATFPSAEAGVKAAADIQARMEDLRTAAPLGRLFRPRVGLSWGRVIREERAGEVDYFGNTVNAAARLMKLSGDGEALIAGSAEEEPGVAALLAAAARESARLKGFEAPVPVLRLRPDPLPRDAKASARLRATAAQARRAIVPAPDGR